MLVHNGKHIPHQGLPLHSRRMWCSRYWSTWSSSAVRSSVGRQRGVPPTSGIGFMAQAEKLETQALELQRQAVIEERLRIARELHDVVAHHVAVIGVQAAAAGRMLRRDPGIAEQSLRSIESSSREAVAQMRGLLGTLRAADGEDRMPEPGLTDLHSLVEHSRAPGFDVEFDVVEDPELTLADVPGPIGLSLYRTVQEALANVRRHSTANRAQVSVRVSSEPQPRFTHGFAEVEVIDEGRPRSGTSGTGLGLLGVRERLSAHGGISEIGPRVTGGYRVRVRLPLGGAQ